MLWSIYYVIKTSRQIRRKIYGNWKKTQSKCRIRPTHNFLIRNFHSWKLYPELIQPLFFLLFSYLSCIPSILPSSTFSCFRSSYSGLVTHKRAPRRTYSLISFLPSFFRFLLFLRVAFPQLSDSVSCKCTYLQCFTDTKERYSAQGSRDAHSGCAPFLLVAGRCCAYKRERSG